MPKKRGTSELESGEKQKRSNSKKKSSKSSAAEKALISSPPPPPPQICLIKTVDDFNAAVIQFRGAVLLSVVVPTCQMCVNTVIPFLIKLNKERPDALKKINIVMLDASNSTQELCEALRIITVPYFASYSYGKLVDSFSGDNVQKALLLAKIAAQAAVKEELQIQEELAAAAAAAAATDATEGEPISTNAT